MIRYVILFLGVFVVFNLLKSYIRNRDKKNSIASKNDTLDEKFNVYKKQKELEVDLILDKVASKGISSLTPKERETLDDYSSNKNT